MDRREQRREHESGGGEKSELAGRKKCRGDEVQSGALSENVMARVAVMWWKGERFALVRTDDEV